MVGRVGWFVRSVSCGLALVGSLYMCWLVCFWLWSWFRLPLLYFRRLDRPCVLSVSRSISLALVHALTHYALVPLPHAFFHLSSISHYLSSSISLFGSISLLLNYHTHHAALSTHSSCLLRFSARFIRLVYPPPHVCTHQNAWLGLLACCSIEEDRYLLYLVYLHTLFMQS